LKTAGIGYSFLPSQKKFGGTLCITGAT